MKKIVLFFLVITITASFAFPQNYGMSYSEKERDNIDQRRQYEQASRLNNLNNSRNGSSSDWVSSGNFTQRERCTSSCFSSDGKYVITGIFNGNIKLWDVATGIAIKTFSGQKEAVYGICLSPDGKQALSISDDKIKLWDITTGKEIKTLTGHTRSVSSVCFSTDGKKALIASSRGKIINLWDLILDKEIITFTDKFEEIVGINKVYFSPDGKQVISISNGSIIIWDISTGMKITSFYFSSGAFSLCFSPDGKQVLSGSYKGELILWDLATRKIIREFIGHTDRVTSVCFSPDGTQVLSGSEDKTVKFWNIATGREISTYTEHIDRVNSVCFSPDGKQAFSISDYSIIKKWDLSNLQTQISSQPVPKQPTTKNADDYLNQGNYFWYGKEWESAIREYTEAIRLNPNLEVAYERRAISYRNLENYDKAIEDYTQIINRSTNNNWQWYAYYHRGAVYEKKGNYDNAIADYTQSIKINPDQSIIQNSYCKRGFIYMKKGNFTQAREDCNKALQLIPGLPSANQLDNELKKNGY